MTKSKRHARSKLLISPRRILETGSQYCGHLSAAMATLLASGHYPVREIHLSNGQNPPSTHAVVEVFYGGAWHLYDPTYGTVYRNGNGEVASYKELRLDPSLIKAELFQRFDPDYRAALKKAGLLTRDARMKERKKYGLKRARKAPQYTKR